MPGWSCVPVWLAPLTMISGPSGVPFPEYGRILIWVVSSQTTSQPLEVQVIAQQWWFTYRYPSYGGIETAQLVLPDLAYHDYEGVALDLDERPRLQRDLGSKNIMLLHNHGTLAVGRTCAEAFLRMYFLERACTMQVRTRMLGGVEADHPTAPDVVEKNAALAMSGGMSKLAEKLVWPALLRKLDRLDPGFRA